MSALLQAIEAELKADPVWRDRLRSLFAADLDPEPNLSAAAYTVNTLAAELGVSQRVIRDAIGRGQLKAVRSGRRYIISAEAVGRWASPPPQASTRPGTRQRPTRTKVAAGPMQRALAHR